MATQQFKGFKVVTSANTTFENGFIYFVRTNAENGDGYLQLDGKKYGTGKDGDDAIRSMLGGLPDGVTTFAEWINSIQTSGVKEISLNNVDFVVADNHASATIYGSSITLGSAAKYGDVEVAGAGVSVPNAITGLGTKVKAEIEAVAESADTRLLALEAISGNSTVVAVEGTPKVITGVTKTEANGVTTFTLNESDDALVAEVKYGTNPADSGKTNWIWLTNSKGESIGDGFDATDFVKAGLLKEAKVEDISGKTYLKLVFILEGGQEDTVYIDVTQLIDIYEADEQSIHLETTADGGKFSAIMDNPTKQSVASYAAFSALSSFTYTLSGSAAAEDVRLQVDIDAEVTRATSAETILQEQITELSGATSDLFLTGVTVNGLTGVVYDNVATVKVTAADTEVGSGLTGVSVSAATTATTSSVLQSIITVLDTVKVAEANDLSSVTSTGKTVTISGTGKERNLEVNLEQSTADTQAAGHIEITKTDNGALYGVMYYSGDDVQA